MGEMKKARFSAGPLTFAVRHELWDGNIQDHPDQGIVILVMADVAGKESTLLRFNCFDFERSYVYGPEMRTCVSKGRRCLAARPRRICTGWTRPSTATRSAGPSAPWGRSCRKCWGALAIRRLPKSSIWRR